VGRACQSKSCIGGVSNCAIRNPVFSFLAHYR
jgi:hypothetical protein